MVKVCKNRFRRKQFFPSFKAYNKCIHTERSGATENFPLQFERKHSLDLCIKDVNNNKGLFNICENDVIVTLQTWRGGQENFLDYGDVLYVQHLSLILWNMAAFARMTEHGRS